MAPLMRVDLPTVDLTVKPEDPLKLAYELGEKLDKHCRNILQDLRGLRVGLMLDAMCSAFNNAFETFSYYRAPSLTAVIGETGAGKSLLIGYLLQQPVVWKPYDNNFVLDLDTTDARSPKVGHGNSQTKGGRIFSDYIDTAGLFDTLGEEADICNAAAVQMLVQSFHTDKVVFVISRSFFDNRCNRLIALVRRIQRIIRNPSRPDILSSVLFLVNEKKRKGRRIDRDEILEELQAALAQAKKNIIADRVRYLPKDPLLKRVFQTVTFTKNEEGRIQEALRSLPKDQREIIRTFSEEIEILEMIEKHAKFMVMDFSSEESRKEIHDWQRLESAGVLAESFTLENMVPNGFFKFKAMMFAVVTYFNNLCLKLVRLNEKMTALEESLKNKAVEKANLEQRNDTSALVDNKIDKEKELSNLVADRDVLLNDVVSLVGSIKGIKGDTTPTLLIELEPNNPITPRSFWAWGGLASYYIFQHDAQVPIVKVVKSQTPGTCEANAAQTNRDQGKYFVWYTPKWHNYKDDCAAKVELYVAKKNLASSQARLQRKERELKAKKDDLSMKVTQITACRGRVDGYKIAITKGKIEEKEKKQRVEELDKEMEALKKEMQELASKRNTTLLELNRYKMMTSLVSRIIIGLKLHQTGEDRQVYLSFLDDFTEESLWKTFGAGVPQKEVRPVRTPSESEFGLEAVVGFYTSGNCLFDAIQLLFGSGSPIELRAKAIERIRAATEFDEAILAGAEGQEKLKVYNVNTDDFEDIVYADKAEYCFNMELDQTWGSEIEIQSLAKVLDRLIVVFQDGTPQFYGDASKEPMFLQPLSPSSAHERAHRTNGFGIN